MQNNRDPSRILPTAPAPARRRGRPRLAPDQVKKEPLTIRTTRGLKDALTAAATASGRSLAHEIEFRLERSLLADRSKTPDALRHERACAELAELFQIMLNDPERWLPERLLQPVEDQPKAKKRRP
jgi:hypothetical protein